MLFSIELLRGSSAQALCTNTPRREAFAIYREALESLGDDDVIALYEITA